MPDSPNMLSRFWQELKRRKVNRVITVYAAAAFVILELTSIVAPSLGLPDWTLNFVIILLCVGLIIAVVFSWIYDVHPEGGIVKTVTVEEIPEKELPPASRGWKITSYVSFIVIVVLIILNIIPRSGEKNNRENSIAVLPFINDSPDQERMYFINATMEAILDNLCKIEDLRVPGRTSVEQYRDNPKPIPTVAEELNVSYILEGSGHRDGNNVRLFIQLLDGSNDRHVWSKAFEADIEEIFSMQSEIALLVASEIEAIITPEEKELIKRIISVDLTAYDFFQRGKEEYWQFVANRNRHESLEQAEYFYNEALSRDTEFALAYTGLARVYWEKHYWESYLNEDFLDTVLFLANRAIVLDDQLSDAYTVRGDYYRESGQADLAIKEYSKAIKLNPNDWMAYYGRGWAYRPLDITLTYRDFHMAASLNRGPELPTIFSALSQAYGMAGFLEQTRYYDEQKFKLTGDTAMYYGDLCRLAYWEEDFENAVVYGKKALHWDSLNPQNLEYLANNLESLGDFEQALVYAKKWLQRIEDLGVHRVNAMHRAGYIYWQLGMYEKADYYFDQQIAYSKKINELGRVMEEKLWTYYDLAAVYAFRGEKDKAYENLRVFNQRQNMSFWIFLVISNDPLFEKIREEPEFQHIVRDVEAKYKAEHKRVRQWLEENDML